MPRKLWELIHPDYKYIAKDSSGEIYAYKDKPVLGRLSGSWIPNDSLGMKFLNKESINEHFRGIYFEDSLMKRHKKLAKSQVGGEI